MDIDALRYFVAIAKGATFTQTAEKYHTTQSSVSKAIARMEQRFGLRLIVRSNHVTSITSAGQQLLKEGELLLFEYDRVVEHMLSITAVPTVRCCIVAQRRASDVAAVVNAFSNQYPHFNVILEPDISDEAAGVSRLQNGELDFLLTHSHFDPERQPTVLGTTVLCDDPLYAVLPLNHPLACCEVIMPEELQRYTPITCEFTYHIIDEIFRISGLDNTARRTNMKREDIIYDVVSGNGITIYYESNLGLTDRSKLICKPIKGFYGELILAFLKGVKLTNACKTFRQYMKNEMRKRS